MNARQNYSKTLGGVSYLGERITWADPKDAQRTPK